MEKTQARLIYTDAMSGTVGRPVESALRKRVSELLKAGKKQAEIADILDKAPSTIAHHVRALGHKAKEYAKPRRVGIRRRQLEPSFAEPGLHRIQTRQNIREWLNKKCSGD